MATWPTFLPAPLQSGYEINPDDPILRTQMDAGPDRVRRRFTAIPSSIPVKWRFSGAEMALFEAWYKHEALDGAAWFNVNLANGLGIQSMEARFTRPPKKPLLSGSTWEVQAELKVRTMPVMSAAEMEVALAFNPNDLAYASPALHTLINTTLPSANYW